MANDFGAVDWTIPSLINCPCFIETMKTGRLPWGYSPFEFVAVGLDSLALATFGNETAGTFGPIMVQSTDGAWRVANLTTLSCSYIGECRTRPGTGESSLNLQWNSTGGVFSWVSGAVDQGVYISGLSDSGTVPILPNPPHDEYLYVRLMAAVGFLTLFDEQSRELGFDQRSGQWVQQIPNSTVIFSRNTEEVIMLNPKQVYLLVINAGGNTIFNLFASKSSNTAATIISVKAAGTLRMGESRSYKLDSGSMQMKSENGGFENTVRAPDFDLVLLVTLWGVGIAAILILLRRRARKHVEA